MCRIGGSTYNLEIPLNNQIEIYKSITREEIREVARKYLNANQRIEIEYLPKKK